MRTGFFWIPAFAGMTIGMKAKKRFGQHFLCDEGVAGEILAAVAPRAGERFLEIGAGGGALTQPLLARGVLLTAAELDRDCISLLRRRFAEEIRGGQLRLLEGDILRARLDDFEPCRVIGNLPYNISAPLLLKLCETGRGVFSDAHLMLQKEVAARLCASPGASEYGRLTVTAACVFDSQTLFNVAPSAFAPPPKVDSAFVRMSPRASPLTVTPLFARVLRAAFQSRRKQLSNALRDFAVDWGSAPVSGDVRPQNLTSEEYAALSEHIGKQKRKNITAV